MGAEQSMAMGRESGYNGIKGMDELLTKRRVKHVWNQSGGGHSWPNWQVYLSKYATLLFRDRPS